MKDIIKAHIISHTHWDREWFLLSKYINQWLIPFFDHLFNWLEKEKSSKFVLDGQTLIIEDYLKQLKIKRKDIRVYQERIKQYVQERRLFIGPYYVQSDWRLVSGESLVRNLLIGHQEARKFGQVMKVGWLVDNFGQISQSVQIHDKFDIEGLFLWRGVEMKFDQVKSEFWWEGPEGTRLMAIYLISSYRNAMRLGSYPEIMKERIENEVRKIYPFATTSNVLLMNGYDLEVIPDDFLPALRKLSFSNIYCQQSSPQEYIEAIRNNAGKLPVVKGSLDSGRFISIFPGTLSARMYLKQMNDHCQRELEKHAEPFLVLAWLNRGKYDLNIFRKIWKELLKNHSHDNICGVCIDDVHQEMERRFRKVISWTEEIVKNGLEMMIPHIDTSKDNIRGEPYLIFNSCLKSRNKIISIKKKKDIFLVTDSEGYILPAQKANNDNLHILVNNIPPMGYKTIYLIKNQSKDLENKINFIWKDKVLAKNNRMENRYLRVEFRENGTIKVLDKLNKYRYENLNIFSDGADAGDEYNYSSPENDRIITNERVKAKIEIVERSNLRTTFRIEIILSLPESLRKDRKNRSRRMKNFPIVNFVTLEADSPLLYFRLEVKNTVKDHRLRVLFPTNIKTDFSFAGAPFDIIKHRITPLSYRDEDIPEGVKRIIIGAREIKSISTFPYQYFVDINDGQRGLAVLSRNLFEYEVLPEGNTLALTIFRAVGWLARIDLLSRIGDAGPLIFTPEAQCLRQMSFEYALYFHQGDCFQARVYPWAEEFNTDLKIIETNQHRGELKDEGSFLALTSKEDILQVSAIKRAEDGRGVVLRIFNPSEERLEGEIFSYYNLRRVYLVNLEEKIKEEVKAFRENRFKLEVKPKEIVTLKLEVIKKDILEKNTKNKEVEIKWAEQEDYPFHNFDNFPSVALLTWGDIYSEEIRVKALERKLNKLRQKEIILENKLKIVKRLPPLTLVQRELALYKTKGEIWTYYRTFLEAKISLLLSRKKYLEIHTEDKKKDKVSLKEIEKSIKELGDKLNEARINKRVYEYIIEYYQNRLKVLAE